MGHLGTCVPAIHGRQHQEEKVEHELREEYKKNVEGNKSTGQIQNSRKTTHLRNRK